MKVTSFLFSICIFWVFLISCSAKKNIPRVYDYEGDLTKEQILKFDSLFQDHERKTTNEIVLVTTPDYGDDSNIVSYAINFSNQHGIGKKSINNGVTLVFCRSKHETSIATGYGTEKILKDEIAKRIIDSIMIPEFKKASYYKGLWNGSKAIIEFLERPENKIK